MTYEQCEKFIVDQNLTAGQTFPDEREDITIEFVVIAPSEIVDTELKKISIRVSRGEVNKMVLKELDLLDTELRVYITGQGGKRRYSNVMI